MKIVQYSYILVIYIICSPLFNQSVNNSFYYLEYLDENDIKDYHTNFSYFQSDLNSHQIHIGYDYYNSIIDYNQKFSDNNLLLIYSVSDKLNNNLDFEISGFIENKKSSPLNDYSSYPNDGWKGHDVGADLRKSYIRYTSNNFSIKLGRDYFQPGHYSFNRILFSSKGYPFDQILFGFMKNNISISSFYLSLSPLSIPVGIETSIDTTRHLNGHRINYKLKNGYIAINELIIYGGAYETINLALLNPLLPYYIYNKNHRRSATNSIFSFEYWQNTVDSSWIKLPCRNNYFNNIMYFADHDYSLNPDH